MPKVQRRKREDETSQSREKRQPSEITVYRPRDIMQDFDKAFDRFRDDFEDLLAPIEPFRRMPPLRWGMSRIPRVDLEDRGKDFLLTADLPGFKKEDVNIEVTDNTVDIKAESRHSKSEERREYVRKERSSETYFRRVGLPDLVKSDAAEANLKDGILQIILPKLEPKTKKKVSIA